jgi:hypothetical protein
MTFTSLHYLRTYFSAREALKILRMCCTVRSSMDCKHSARNSSVPGALPFLYALTAVRNLPFLIQGICGTNVGSSGSSCTSTASVGVLSGKCSASMSCRQSCLESARLPCLSLTRPSSAARAPVDRKKYHNLNMCIKAQTCLGCKLLQNVAIFFLYFVSLFLI